MALTQYYVDPGGGNDTTGTGAIGTPWKTVQHALDSITRNSTDGDQVNVKAGTADVLGAALSLTTYGTPTAAAPLIIRGYTSAADDGGQGEIDGDATYSVFATASTGVSFVDMKLGNCGAADIIETKDYGMVAHCELHNTSGYAVDAAGPFVIRDCYIHDVTGSEAIDDGSGIVVEHNYIVAACTLAIVPVGQNSRCVGNILRVTGADTSVHGVWLSGHNTSVEQNIITSANANTSNGIYGQYGYAVIQNNIICGWSGAGGDAITLETYSYVGPNAYYNCTANKTVPAAKWAFMAGADVVLAADPFVDAANGDFSLTAAAKTALRGVGWPAAYLGAHVNTDGHITIGAIQYGEAEAGGGGGGPVIGSRIIRGLGAV